MDSSVPLRAVEPRPMSPSTPSYPPMASAPEIGGVGLQHGPEQIPDHPASMMDVPRPSNNYGQQSYAPMAQALPTPTDVKQLKSQCQFNLREYQALQRKRMRPDASVASVDMEQRLRAQQSLLVNNMRALQDEVSDLVKKAENHRWRKWLLGGTIASFIPLVRRIFRRGSDDESMESTNDTEYAFKRSKGLLARIKDSVLGKGSLAGIAFFVFAVMYVFQNEVTLRVAKTVQKRVRRLTARLERGDPDIDEKDLKLLDGWRWRVLLW